MTLFVGAIVAKTLFKKIVVVVDSTADSHPEIDQALKLANQSETTLHLVDVVKDVSFTVRLLSREYAHIHELLVAEKQNGLANLIQHCRAHGVETTGEVLEGHTSEVTIQAAKSEQADLIIRPAKGLRSVERGRLGSSTQRLLRNLPCSAFITQGPISEECRVIVAAVDATPNDNAHGELNRQIISTALALTERAHCKLHVAYAWNLYGADMLKNRLPASEFEHLLAHNRKQHQESFESLLAEFDLHATGPDTRMLEGEPSLVIPELCRAEQANLLVCGTIARHGISGLLLGNTSERIMHRVECPFLALVPKSS